MFSICVSEKEAQLDELHETTSDLEELLQQSGIPTQKGAGTQSPYGG